MLVFMKKFLLFAICAMAFIASSCTQSALRYSVAGRYKGQAAQGMAIWENTAYLLSNGGRCRVYDLETGTVTAEFMLQSAWEGNHCNSANFGWEIPEGGDKPAMYIAECYGGHRLFVENMLRDTSELVQTITVYENGKVLPVFSWALDNENKCMYGCVVGSKLNDEIGSVYTVITKIRMPRLDEGKEVILTEDDFLGRFSVAFPNLTQGVALKGNHLYMVTGASECETPLQYVPRSLKVIDLRAEEITKEIDLSLVTTCEPEDIDFYKGKMLMYTGGDGGLYEINYK